MGAVALTLTSEALSVVSEKGIIWEELGASLITGLSCNVTGKMVSTDEKKTSILLTYTPFSCKFLSTIKVWERGLIQFVDVEIRLIVSWVTFFSLTFSRFGSNGLVDETRPERDSRSPWTLKIFSATDSVLATVSVELSVKRNNLSPTR